MDKLLKNKFINNVFKNKKNKCWEWKGYLDKDGYGQFYPKTGNPKRAHRFSYELFIGKIPQGMFVCHKCDNPSCVNPKHLWVGSSADNVRDMVNKKRKPRIISFDDYLIVKKMYKTNNYTQHKLASIFNVGKSTINNVLNDNYNYK